MYGYDHVTLNKIKLQKWHHMLEILPMMLVLCLMLFNALHTQDYAGLISTSLVATYY